MKIKAILLGTIFSATLLTSCDVDKKGKLELPEVDVEVSAEEGNLPEFDVDWADIDITTTTKTVEVPKVVVVMEEEKVEVPFIDVDMPDEEKIERTLVVETEVFEKEADLEIREIRATDDNLYVIADLEEKEQELDGQTLRVQDQVELKAPDMNVKYVIVGKEPKRLFNKSNMYVNSIDELDDSIKDAEVIYTK